MEYARYLNKDLAIYMNDVFREHMDFLDNPAEGVARRIKDAVKIFKKQGKSDEWIAIRFDGMAIRKFLTSDLALPPLLYLYSSHRPKGPVTNNKSKVLLGTIDNMGKDVTPKGQEGLKCPRSAFH